MADKKRIFLTGAAGFIGMHLALALKARGDEVIGYDNFCPYYDPSLKRRRAQELKKADIEVIEGDICDKNRLKEAFSGTHCVHLAAQAGVRHSISHPEAYLKANLEGFLNILELMREHPGTPLIYASSSSVYGGNKKIPFSCDDRTDEPINFYAATKKANELMAYAYHNLYGIAMSGLRFFTVYGPWGRPDMAYYSFTKAISEGLPISLYNKGAMRRDFTYIDDIVQGTLAAIDQADGYNLYNLGNNRSEELLHFVAILEKSLGRKAEINFVAHPPSEMIETFADIEESKQVLQFEPKVSLEEGLPRFVEWYKQNG